MKFNNHNFAPQMINPYHSGQWMSFVLSRAKNLIWTDYICLNIFRLLRWRSLSMLSANELSSMAPLGLKCHLWTQFLLNFLNTFMLWRGETLAFFRHSLSFTIIPQAKILTLDRRYVIYLLKIFRSPRDGPHPQPTMSILYTWYHRN